MARLQFVSPRRMISLPSLSRKASAFSSLLRALPESLRGLYQATTRKGQICQRKHARIFLMKRFFLYNFFHLLPVFQLSDDSSHAKVTGRSSNLHQTIRLERCNRAALSKFEFGCYLHGSKFPSKSLSKNYYQMIVQELGLPANHHVWPCGF